MIRKIPIPKAPTKPTKPITGMPRNCGCIFVVQSRLELKMTEAMMMQRIMSLTIFSTRCIRGSNPTGSTFTLVCPLMTDFIKSADNEGIVSDFFALS